MHSNTWSPAVAVMVVVPLETHVTLPVSSMAATPGLALVQVTAPS